MSFVNISLHMTPGPWWSCTRAWRLPTTSRCASASSSLMNRWRSQIFLVNKSAAIFKLRYGGQGVYDTFKFFFLLIHSCKPLLFSEKLSKGSSGDALMAYQIAFDMYESATQQFLSRVLAAIKKTAPVPQGQKTWRNLSSQNVKPDLLKKQVRLHEL